MTDPTTDAPRRSPLPLTRRTTLKGIAGAAGLALAGLPRPAVHAQGLSGRIVIGFEDPDDVLSPVVAKAVQELRQANPDATIEIQRAAPGSFQQQLILGFVGGDAPDVFHLTGLGIGELAAAGYIAPLNDFVATWDGWGQFSPAMQAGVTYQGNVYAIPYGVDAHFLYYRKDRFAQAGLPTEWQPRHPDEILAAARQVKERVPDVIPYALYAGANGREGTAIRGLLALVYAFGGAMQDEQGRWIIDSCAVRQTLAYYATAYRVDQTVPQEVMTNADPVAEMREAFGAGELAILYEGSWAYRRWEQDDPADTAANIGWAHLPYADGSGLFTVGSIGNGWYINANAEPKDLAWAFVAAVNTREAQIALNLADPRVPTRQDALNDPAFQATPFLRAVAAAPAIARMGTPSPAYRRLIGIVQNATGIVAIGEVGPKDAVARYASELTRVLGEDQVVAQPCP